jgi:hypothetical protein
MVTLVLSIFIVAALLVAATAYYRPFSPAYRRLRPLWALRAAMALLVLCAFFEPVLNLRLLRQDGETITVLLDASRSMRLFKNDSLVTRLIETIRQSLPGFSKKTPSLQVLCFGDSLRACAEPVRCSYGDGQSFFPIVAISETLDQSRLILIVSDGNWSNPSLPRAVMENKNRYYLRLTGFTPAPYLSAECISFQPHVAQDSPSVATLAIQGFKKNGQPLEIVAREKGRCVFQTLRKADSGYFSDTVSVRFPSSRPGRYCDAVRVGAGDSLCRRLHLVGDVVPREFTAAFYNSAPTLDRRFLSLALTATGGWKQENGAGADALFLFDWDDRARQAFSRLKPSGIAVFVGCLPCSTRYIGTLDSFSVLAAQPDDSLTRRLEAMNVPPPSCIVASACPALSSRRTLLQCVARKKTPLGMTSDSLPFLFWGSFGGRGALVLAARDIWKMEFLPLAVDRENENPSFLRDVLAILRERLYANVNRRFFVYPAAAELYDQDSAGFAMVFPEVGAETGESALPAKIIFSVTRDGSPLLDTTFVANVREAGAQTLRLPPLPSGACCYTATLFQGASRFVIADTAFVQHADGECSIPGQNTVLLNQVAVPLELGEVEGALRAAINAAAGKNISTRTLTLQIRQSWPLLLALIFLLTAEWLWRRKAGLDR